ncbi:MAG: sulfatase [Planctomycetes bacterium]|nr:sulfatase [Planctomycetota bacterium]
MLQRIPLSLLLSLAGFASCSREAQRPNVILIVIDTLRSDRLGCYGYPRATSPEIDELASEGVVFEECVAQAPWTMQSMPSMLAGRYLTQHRNWPDPRHVLLAEHFRAAGYATIGASANDLLSAEMQFDRGFDAYDSSTLPGEVDKPCDVLVKDLLPKLDALRAAKKDAPIFLYLQPFDPHFPYLEHHEFDLHLPTDETEAVQPEGWQAEELVCRGAPAPTEDFGWAKELIGLRHQRGLYDQEVRFTDHAIGVFLDELRARGLLNGAVVAIVSDHGEGMWEHVNKADDAKLATLSPNGFFFAGHAHHVYEEAIRTPFVLWGRGVPKGERFSAPVENVDLFPTLCALAGLATPKDANGQGVLDGRDLTLLFGGKKEGPRDWREHTYAFMPHVAMVRERASGLKLIVPTCSYRAPEDGIPSELFDLAHDADERVNLFAQRADDAARLTRVLQSAIDAHPTTTTWGAKKPPKIEAALRESGYSGVGDNPDEHDEPTEAPPRPRPDPRVLCDTPR